MSERLYCDARIGGVPQWVIGDPRELRMRIPSALLDPPVFLCVDQGGGQFRMAGTAFFLALRESDDYYLVTARHCVERAQAYGDLYVRLNTNDGGSEVVRLNGEWYYGASDADDVAIMLVPTLAVLYFDIWAIELPVWCVSDETIEGEGIGVGDEVVAIGLFTRRDGKQRNRPIVRSGIISSMPDEPLEDINTGLEYDAYLMEIRSIGGLSGSPVFVILPFGRSPHGTYAEEQRAHIYLIGLVRGHWNRSVEEFADFGESEVEQLNTGIAIVTPIQKAVEIIMNREELVKKRNAQQRRRAERSAPTEDSPLPDDGGEFSRFERFTRSLLKVPKTELDEKRREG